MTVVSQVKPARFPAFEPAIGRGTLLRGRPLVTRVLLLALVCALGAGTLAVKAASHRNGFSLPALQGAARVAPGVLRGGQPADFDLLQLRNGYRVRAVVNVRLAGTQEGAVAREFGLDYLALPIPPDAAPSPADLDQLVSFLRSHEQSSDVVYVHDDVGGGRVVSLAAMLLMLRGDPLNSVLATLSADELRHMSAGQWAALYALEAALRDPADPRGASYRSSRGLRW